MKNKILEKLMFEHKKITTKISKIEAVNGDDAKIKKLLGDLDRINKRKKILDRS